MCTCAILALMIMAREPTPGLITISEVLSTGEVCSKLRIFPKKQQSRIKVHFVATFWNIFLIVFVSAFRNVDCI